MSLLFESIKIEDGKWHNLFYHEQRMRRSWRMLWGEEFEFDLEESLKHLPIPTSGIHKCKIIYDEKIREIEWAEYKIKPIQTLKLVEHNRIDYSCKFVDRTLLNDLFEKREKADDVLIVKQDRVTDTSYANIILLKKNKWFTPYQPLLKGTMRQNLVDRNQIIEEEISVDDLRSFEKVKLINAMLGTTGPEIDIRNIID
ncbi:MAG: aminotransferase class IV [Chryseotalea sp.]|jgi:4-amino-4-deoxychorismate lyase|nr:aminotransferase class IV [Cytophagales bacterium]